MSVPTAADLERAKLNLGAFDNIVNLDENTTVTTPGGAQVDTVAKAIATLKAYNFRGNWAQGTSYAVKDLVIDPDDPQQRVYIRVTAGTSPSGGSPTPTFQSEYANGVGPWRIFQGERDLFDTVAEAVSTRGSLNGETRYTAGFSSIGDGGHASYQWRDGSTAQHDGVSVFEVAGSGSPSTPGRWHLLHQGVIRAKQAGAKGDDVANDTAPLVAWKNALKTTGAYGFWDKGTYQIDEGQFVIEPDSNVDTPGPVIFTAGYKATIVKGRGTAQAALVTIRNLTQVSGVGKFIKGGYFGSLGFDGSLQNAGWSAAHGLSLRGLNGVVFGDFEANGLKGDLVHIQQNLFAGSNPDPYHVAFCEFGLIQQNSGAGWALNNDNYFGFNQNTIRSLACYNTTGKGALRSSGSGNTYRSVSVGGCSGYAIDIYDGTTAGRSQFETIENLELDNPEYGIRMVNGDQCNIKKCRFVHRFNTAPDKWYPIVALNLSDNSGNNPPVLNCEFDFVHRIDDIDGAGNSIHQSPTLATIGKLGKFLEANNSSGIAGVTIRHKVQDNAGLGVTNDTLLANNNIGSSVPIVIESASPVERSVIYDNRYRVHAEARASGGATILDSGFGSAPNKLAFGTEDYDKRGDYDAANYAYVVPASGPYRVQGQIHIAGLTDGNRVRLGLMGGAAGTTLIKMREFIANGTGRQCFAFEFDAVLTKGWIMSINGDTNKGSPLSLDVVYGGAVENFWSITMLNAAAVS